MPATGSTVIQISRAGLSLAISHDLLFYVCEKKFKQFFSHLYSGSNKAQGKKSAQVEKITW